MSHELELVWESPLADLSQLDLRLYAFAQQRPGQALLPTQQGDRLVFSELEAGCYVLSCRYQWQDQHFDSFYFQLDSPDISLIRLKQGAAGAQIEQMGCYSGKEFIDMLVYEHSKPCLTRSLEKAPLLQALCEWLSFRAPALSAPQQRQNLHALIGNLAQAVDQLAYLWPWQIKYLLQPALLAQTTPEWKACLLHLLRNDPILLDNESLYEHLQEAAALAQQEDTMEALLENLEWDPQQQHWLNWEQFLHALQGKGVLSGIL
ncbi:MAG: hypothetical protein ACO1RX_09920 [Candidatus Sericytochromatia bacterium]